MTEGQILEAAELWRLAKENYLTARRAELAFDAEHILPETHGIEGPSDELRAAASRVPHDIWVQSERLLDARSDAEDVLMAIPSPDAAAFAFKVLIATADDRDADCWDDMLCREARQFAPDFLFYSEVKPARERVTA